MCCINGHPDGLPGKNGHIIKLAYKYHGLTLTQLGVVVEDSKVNCEAAAALKYTVVWAEKGKDDYLRCLERIEAEPSYDDPLRSSCVDNRRIHDADLPMNFDEITDFDSAKMYLNQEIFNLKVFKYEDKSNYAWAVQMAFRQLIEYHVMQPANQKWSVGFIVDQLSDLYNFINAPTNKEKINIHKYPWLDEQIGKINTKSWIKLIEIIRNMSLETLFAEAERLISHDRSAASLRQSANWLEDYCLKGLFSEHRSNGFFSKKEGPTGAVEQIKKKIADYRTLADSISPLVPVRLK